MLNKENLKDIYTLSPMQKGMYFHSLKEKTAAYFEQMHFMITGTLHREHVEEAFNYILQKYDVLRTVFLHKNLSQPMQVVLKERYANVEFQEISHLDQEEASRYVQRFKKEDQERGFDLSKDLLIRLSVLREGDVYHLVWSMHHILMDGWCLGLIFNDFFDKYHKYQAGLPVVMEKVPPYSEYIRWLEKQDKEKARAYWKQYLAGYSELTGIHPMQRKDNDIPGEPAEHLVTLDRELTQKLSLLAKEWRVTLNTVFQTLWGILLSKYNNKGDIVFGSVVSGRPSEIPQVENMVGLFINTVPVRVQIQEEDNFGSLLTRIHQSSLAAKSYEYTLLADIQADTGFSGALFDHILVFENYPIGQKGMAQQDFTIDNISTFEQTTFPLNVVIRPGEEISIKIEFDSSIYSIEEISRLGGHIGQLAHSITSSPDESVHSYTMLTDAEERQLFFDFQGETVPYDKQKNIPQLFEEQVERTPHLAAVTFEDKSMTYAQLNARVNRLARRLREIGVQREQIVGIMAERSMEMIVGVLAILKAGGAYVPIDYDYPPERVRYLLEDSGTRVLLTCSQAGKTLEDMDHIINLEDEASYAEDDSNLEMVNSSTDLAYVIYTSGSTGAPKGVMIEHQALHNLTLSAGVYGIQEGSKVLQFASLSFDASVGDIFHTLLTGATLVLSRKEQLLSGLSFIEWLNEQEITSIPFLTPSVIKHLPYRELPKLTTISTGGEVLPADVVRTWGVGRRFLNAYGPTETTVDAAIGLCLPSMNKPTIGKPTINKKIYILDAAGALQPIGVPGEMYIGGEGLARGYLHRPELTADKFVANPFEPGTLLYKTGDLARWLADGNIEFLGRIDDQVKIRGFRIELGEIEACLNQAPSVIQAVVAAHQRDAQDYLCAYIVSEGELDISALRQFARETLPEYMVPSFFMQVESIPLNVNGKIDRAALPEPENSGFGQQHYEAPSNPTETALVSIWQKVLGVERIGVEDNFFDLGGHSIKAMMLATQIHKELQVEVPLREIFALTTIKQMAGYIDGIENTIYSAIERAPNQQYYPVSSAQKRLYIIQKIEDTDSGTSYNMPSFYRLRGGIDIKKLEEVLLTIINRHESLRTSFHMIGGEIVQRVHQQVDWVLSYAVIGEESLEDIKNEFIQSFDLSQAPLFRASIVSLGKDEHVLMMDLHHIVGDGISSGILFDELARLYRNETLEEVSAQYKDYVWWQQAESKQHQEDEAYWLEQYSGELPVLELPTDYPRPPVRSFDGAYITHMINEEAGKGLKKYAQKERMTLYMVLLAVYDILLHKYTNQSDIIVGVPITDRPHPDLRNTVGMFVNTLAIRNQFDAGEPFGAFARRVKNQVLNMYKHQNFPFEELSEKLSVTRDVSRHPLFDTMFGVQNLEMPEFTFQGLDIEPLELNWRNSKFDMSWMVFDSERLMIGVEYNTSIFSEETIRRMLGHFERIVEQILTKEDVLIEDIELITAAEKLQILEQFNHKPAQIEEFNETIQELFEEQVQKTPDSIAVVYKDEKLTYEELNNQANRIARLLREQAADRDRIIAIMLDRSPDLLIGILATLKAGAAYLPIDPQYPEDRIAHMLTDSGAICLLTQTGVHIPDEYDGSILYMDDADIYRHEDISNLKPINRPEDLAYVIYTSGSTGKPKGVMIEHRSLHNLLYLGEPYGIRAGSRVLQFASISFDSSVAEIFPSLLTGATLYMEEKDELLSGLLTYMKQHEITTVTLSPSLLRALPAEELPQLQYVISAGEACSVDIARTWGENRTFINAYGPTEATVCASYEVITPDSLKVTIGKPFKNQQLYIINAQQQLQPIGVPGELCIGGRGLSRGYLNRPELTNERFIEHPFSPEDRLYKTGDLARWLPDGRVEYLGRMDDQVKVRGNRVELGEITNCLVDCEPVKDAVVIPVQDEQAQTILCGYITVEGSWSISELRRHLGEYLPEFMIPAHFIEVDFIPLTANGKVDKKALPDPLEYIRKNSFSSVIPASNPQEKMLVQVWEEVLQIEPIGVHHNFFELGGDSIKALQIAARLSKEGYKLDTRHMFKNPTIAAVAPFIESTTALADQSMVEGELPLTPIQHWFFEQEFVHQHHFNQSMMLHNEQGWERSRLEQVFTDLAIHHDALRMVYPEVGHGNSIKQYNRDDKEALFTLAEYDLSQKDEAQLILEREANALQESMNLSTGPLIKLGLFHTSKGDYLLIVVHHLVIDGVSWRILLEDFNTLYNQQGELPAKTTSFYEWAYRLNEFANHKKMKKELVYWQEAANVRVPPLPMATEKNAALCPNKDYREFNFSLGKQETEDLLTRANHAYKTKSDDLLLAALVMALQEWTQEYVFSINLEGHGRETIMEGIDLSRTVGWFTTQFPIIFRLESVSLSDVIKLVKETLRKVPSNGIGYGILKYLSPNTDIFNSLDEPSICFNYLGQLGDGSEEKIAAPIKAGEQISLHNHSPYPMEWTCIVSGGELQVNLTYNPHLCEEEEIKHLFDSYSHYLVVIINHCNQRDNSEMTPSDFSTKKLSSDDLDDVFATLRNL
ncbi:non-ribosomal peptide synthetase [Paenibacillus lentus]|uniref:Amino acid adenylation domain-containing protein n=1 Tax=Paenibacillus lentus TaxID=1338368 RepID=A0A3S8S0J4_9BACL|nr:non-ribosomal peptide synthetase [Paenibacillus lentus]AZK48668.1 amino acid adenylation domain-containing protein [Paenibacillus lentus]